MATADQDQKKKNKKAEKGAPGTPVSEERDVEEQEAVEKAAEELAAAEKLAQASQPGNKFRQRGGSKLFQKNDDAKDHIDLLVEHEMDADARREIVDLFHRIEDVTERHAKTAKEHGHHGVAGDLTSLRDVARQAAKRVLNHTYTKAVKL